MTANDTVTRSVSSELRRRGLSRSDFARLMGRTPAWVTKKLSGERRWSVDDLDALAAGLDVPIERLMRATRR